MIGLRRGRQERVHVLVPRLVTVEAAVARVVTGAAELALLQPPAMPLRFLHRRRATIVPLAGDGRVDGTLLAVPGPDGKVRDDVLHFLQAVVPLAPPRPEQRRDHARIDLVRPAAIIPEGFQVGWLNGFVRNVSAGGVLVAGAEALESGDRLRLRFELDDEEDLIDLIARVVRTDDDVGLRGLRLENLSERERERIVRFVFARQRRALAELRARAV
ncbi:MAG TPA: PilZ domain-containing protein [Baekduia sp.]|uniref:PilZ domain-containing protein n=1 Tax=Baekduia sp. TaxID=2600305 RepID=UPI002C4F439C|nr:PilZ domain-containing protein [Baekduia sp.]HMJ34381.1 PilZ domain-containing protein [Baekduia sp.]